MKNADSWWCFEMYFFFSLITPSNFQSCYFFFFLFFLLSFPFLSRLDVDNVLFFFQWCGFIIIIIILLSVLRMYVK